MTRGFINIDTVGIKKFPESRPRVSEPKTNKMATTGWTFLSPSPSSLVLIFQKVTDPSYEPHAMRSPVVETAISVILDCVVKV
jgi:hypothetical protein